MTEVDYIPRGVEPSIEAAIAEARVACIIGPRQAGKSTVARRVATRHGFPAAVSFDETAVREAAQRDPGAFVAGLPTPALIDEIQRVPDVLLEIKHRVDHHPVVGQFLLTGSADFRSIASVRDALPGRVDYITLLPLAQRELEQHPLAVDNLIDGLFDADPPMLRAGSVGIDAHVQRIAAGGFAESTVRSSASRERYFEGYVASVLDRDLRDVARVRDTAAFGRLLGLLSARTAQLVNRSRLARDVGLDDKTVASHIDTMARMYLLHVLPSWHVNIGHRHVKSPKIHLADSGLLAHLRGLDASSLASSEHIGAICESFVVCELARLATFARGRVTAFHYRDQDRREVDVVLERRDGSIVGVEVKTSSVVRSSELRGLEHLRDRAGERFRSGVVLHPGSRTLALGDRLWALPLEALWTTGNG
jgi:predicted AAA+ superfamily ATPase